jgi:hypothetical protein
VDEVACEQASPANSRTQHGWYVIPVALTNQILSSTAVRR